jgi:hypothetical protein
MKYMSVHLTPPHLPLDKGRKGGVIKAGWPGYRPIMCCWQSFPIPKAFGNHKCINCFADGGQIYEAW